MRIMERTVIVVAQSAGKARKITTSATTWGELKAQREVSELIVGNVEAVCNPGNVTLVRDDAELPDGDFKVYLVPTKNKAGTISDSQASDIGYAIADAIRKASARSNADQARELQDSLIYSIEDFFGVDLDEDDCPECQEALREADRYLSE